MWSCRTTTTTASGRCSSSRWSCPRTKTQPTTTSLSACWLGVRKPNTFCYSTTTRAAPNIVTSTWLATHGDQVRLVDASWSMQRHLEPPHVVRLPGVPYFDIDDVADKNTRLPHMLPSRPVFESKMTQLGLRANDHLVFYDHSNGQFVASARAWWTMRAFGHKKVSVLEGGYEGIPRGYTPPLQAVQQAQGTYVANDVDTELVWDKYGIMDLLGVSLFDEDRPSPPQVSPTQIIDARSADRYNCKVPEPREDVPKGAIPGALNVPFMDLLQKEERPSRDDPKRSATVYLLKDKAKLETILKSAAVDKEKPALVYCGSGVTACIVALALATLGKERVGVYDGSWTEWGVLQGVPKTIKRLPQV